MNKNESKYLNTARKMNEALGNLAFIREKYLDKVISDNEIFRFAQALKDKALNTTGIGLLKSNFDFAYRDSIRWGVFPR